MHQLIASPFLDEYLVVRPGHDTGVQISRTRYLELSKAVAMDADAPQWLIDGSRRAWGLTLPAHRPLRGTVLVRALSLYGMARASYEINKGCDYDCPHCYLGLKRFEGMPWADKVRLLDIMRDAGVRGFRSRAASH